VEGRLEEEGVGMDKTVSAAKWAAESVHMRVRCRNVLQRSKEMEKGVVFTVI
jgi:hypothetical protein